MQEKESGPNIAASLDLHKTSDKDSLLICMLIMRLFCTRVWEQRPGDVSMLSSKHTWEDDAALDGQIGQGDDDGMSVILKGDCMILSW